MKISLITDLHFGVRNDNQALLENNKKFFRDHFFPYLKEHNIKTVVCLGDLVDRRKFINYNTAQCLRQSFIEPMMIDGIEFHWILGNHDIYYRQTLEVNAAVELFKYREIYGPSNFSYYTQPQEVYLDIPILFLPWICDENREKSLELINNTKAQVVFGHLEIQGFEMYKGLISHHGDTPNLFRRFDLVCTGHYHQKSSDGCIHYLGAHAEFTWADCGHDRGFHIFDTSTRELVYVDNPCKMFAKVFYDDTNDNFKKTNFSQLSQKFVKVIVTNRNNPLQYDWFMNQIEESRPIDVTVVNDHLNLDLQSDENIVSESKDTLTIMREFAQTANNVVNSKKLDKLFIDLYNMAQASE